MYNVKCKFSIKKKKRKVKVIVGLNDNYIKMNRDK